MWEDLRWENIIKEKSFLFAVKIVHIYKYLKETKKEYILSKQLLRSGTAIGAMVRESEYAVSKADFIHKLSISLKESNESVYWLELLKVTGFITNEKYKECEKQCIELIKILTSIINSTKSNNTHNY